MTYLLQVKGLYKSFGGIKAINNVSLKVQEGEIVGLIGPNGSGKSTFVNLVCGLYHPDAGQVLLKGNEVTGLDAATIASKGVARTFQASRPFLNLTVMENVIIAALLHEPLSKAEKKAEEIIKFTGLEKYRDIKCASLPIEIRKRLDISRALAINPCLIMLDEAMAGLNPKEMEEGIKLVQRINQEGITVIFIEHVIKAVMALSHRIIVLNQGELLIEGDPQTVINDEKVIKAYLGDGFAHVTN
ncbi:ABC transporter ATP-binding protein [Moorella naiadis]|uniref:ABC transporter ATP-binding protein n=1 Tax=Moorella naiadis (nom. illeg.) TaxID=3093670 RepID=UPI003D9C9F2C